MGNKPGLILRENFSKETQTLIDERSFLKVNTTGVFVYRLYPLTLGLLRQDK